MTTLPKIILQATGGLAVDSNPTVYTDREEAERDARARILSVKTGTPSTRWSA